MSAPQLLWSAAGEPAHKYLEETTDGSCATCAAPLDGLGISTEAVNNPTFSSHSEFFRYGTHVCRACAWLYGDPKRTHRNVLALPGGVWWPMISVESATPSRPSWLEVLSRLTHCSPETPVAGVLTTDPKPRNWPRMRLSTVGAFGLYVHAPSFDVSEYRTLDLEALAEMTEPILAAQALGFTRYTRRGKSQAPGPIHSGLHRDYQRFREVYEEASELETALESARGQPEFVPAVLITQLTKAKKGVKDERESDTRASGEPRGGRVQDPTRLF